MDSENRDRHIAAVFGEALEDGMAALEGYKIVKELGRGGMATVYLAQQLNPMREVALKVMLPCFIENQEIRERFKLEGHMMAKLEDAGVLPVYEVGEWNGLSYIAMRLARGGTLQDILNKETPEVRRAVEWLIRAAETVHLAHQRGILHRDLKPANLLFDDRGSIYVGDFGIAEVKFTLNDELTTTEGLVGTPHYLAPEIASGAEVSGSVASDIYSLGAVLYECLTGERPHYRSDNLASLLRHIVHNELTYAKQVCPDVPEDLADVCTKALAKNPKDRYESVLELLKDLRQWYKEDFYI